jgi:hypothetical protein
MKNSHPDELREAPATYATGANEDIDLELLKDNLTRTPWERMLANDDALNFAESLRVAMEKRNATLK